MRRLPWLFGVALLVVVILAVRHVSEARDFARLSQQAQPWWLLLAVALQAGTYMSQGQVYRMIAHVSRMTLGLFRAARLSLTKLFVDQAIPSGGLSGTVVVAGALQREGIPRRVVAAGIVVDFAGNYVSYVLCLVVALAVMTGRGQSSVIILVSALLFVLFAVGSTVLLLALAGRGAIGAPRWVRRVRLVTAAFDFVREAEPRVARSRALIFRAATYHLVILLCDAATIWVLIRAFGGHGPPAGVFASFMISSLLRQVAFVPGGLGTFEAASVVTLKLAGVPVALGLAATLVFRGLSFWLPMLPGLWFWRREMTRGAA